MARVLIDDLTEELIRDESEGGTIRLTLDTETVELDLSTASQEKLATLLAPYMSAGRQVAQRGRPRGSGTDESPATPPAATGTGPSDAEIRTWARENNVPVNDIGRVKASAREAYARAHEPGSAPPAPPAQDSAPAAAAAANGHAPLARPERPRPAQIEQAEQMLGEGTTVHAVADSTGLTVAQVREVKAAADEGRTVQL